MSDYVTGQYLSRNASKPVKLGNHLCICTSSNEDLDEFVVCGTGYWSVTYGLDKESK